MDGIRKTALLLIGLDGNAVDLLLGRLDPEDAKAVRREMRSLRSVSEAESTRVAVEFLETSGVRRRSLPSNELLPGQSSSGLYGPPTPKRRQQPMRFPAEAFEPRVRRPFDFLNAIDAETIADELSPEHPQTISVVLANVSRRIAAEILGFFPVALRNDVTRRLTEYEPVDEQIVTEIADSLQERFKNSNSDSDFPFDFSDLQQLSNLELSRLFRSVDIETAVLALVGAKASLIERVVQRFTPTEEHEFRRQIKRLGSLDERDVLEAKRKILALAASGSTQ